MMSENEIIKSWNMGLNKFQIADEYRNLQNKEASRRGDIERISKQQALAHVEPIIFNYMVKQLKGEK